MTDRLQNPAETGDARPAGPAAAPAATARNYPLLLASQFLSAFGDNFILMVILGPFLDDFKLGRITARDQSVANIFYTSLIFIPYVLLAPAAGYLNDRFAKTRWLWCGNFIKLAGTAVVAAGLAAGSVFKAAGYLIVGAGACVYSPAKYGILPEILPTARLVKANGTVELLTLVAILTGAVGGSMAFDHLPPMACYGIVAAVYGLSLALNLLMAPTPSYPELKWGRNVREFFANLHDIFSTPRLARIILGTSLFWICGAIIKMNSQPWGQQVLQLKTMTAISLLGVWLALGVMTGSVLAGQLYPVGELRATRRYGWLLAVGIGVLGSVGALMRHGLDAPQTLSIAALCVCGLFAGLFLIPLNAALQAESHKDKLGKTIATQNACENLAMLAGSGIAYLDVQIGFDPSGLFLALALFVAVVTLALKIPRKAI